jgi:hypothetical protein
LKYAGWIPNVLGRLSFTTYRSQLLGNAPSDNVNFVFEIERRDLLDTIAFLSANNKVGKYLQEFVAQKVFSISGKFLFIFVAEFDERNDALKGEVRIIAEALHDNAVTEIKCVSREIASDFKKAHDFIDDKSPEVVSGWGYWKTSVSIARSGEVCIDTGLISDNPQSRENDSVIAEQVYYFLKDLFHNHQHHDANSDSIITVSAINEKNPDAWIDSVHHSLFRAIIRYKRYQTERQISKSLGILAYTKAFEKTFKNTARIKNFETNYLRDSLIVAQDDARRKRDIRTSFAESVKNSFFAFFAFLISLSILLRFSEKSVVDVDKTIVFVSTSVVGNFWVSALVVGVISCIVAIITHVFEPADLAFVRGILRTFQGIRLRYFVITNVIISVFTVGTGWYLLFH